MEPPPSNYYKIQLKPVNNVREISVTSILKLLNNYGLIQLDKKKLSKFS